VHELDYITSRPTSWLPYRY